jgi:carbamoyltransferase
MSTVLGVNAVFHDPAAAIVVDGDVVAAAEEERFSRRKHGKNPVAFSTWELPEHAAWFCLRRAGVQPSELDAIAYSYDPTLATAFDGDVVAGDWEGLRTLFVQRAPLFLRTALPGLDPSIVRFVPHHVAHAASAFHASPYDDCAVMVIDGRGERGSYLAGVVTGGHLRTLARQDLPHSLGLLYEELTAHLGYRRSSDEYKIMALASYGRPTHLDVLRRHVRTTGDGRFCTTPIDWSSLAPAGQGDGTLLDEHANLACSVQTRLEEVVIELAEWLHRASGQRQIVLAGGVALNCVANSALYENGPFDDVWVQPAAGDAGTALGAAMYVSHDLGDAVQPMRTAALGPSWTDDEIEHELRSARVAYERPPDIADAVAGVLASDGVVGWFQGRSEYGPRALGHRSLLAHPGKAGNVDRLNEVKGRESFRPVAPMVTVESAADIFEGGPIPSPYMLFTHRVRPEWRDRLPAVVHVDGTARIQTVDSGDEPLMHRCIRQFESRTGLPAVVNTSLNTAGRPMVDGPRDALECFGSAPLDALALGPFLLRRAC